jgi:hypothetical protein
MAGPGCRAILVLPYSYPFSRIELAQSHELFLYLQATIECQVIVDDDPSANAIYRYHRTR